MQDLLSGDLPAPPMSATLKFGLTEVEEGRVVFKGLPTEEHLNPLGTVHGGWTATIMDSALGCAVFTTVKPGEAYTTVEFKVNLVRPLLPGMGEVFCEGASCIAAGRSRHRKPGFATATASCWPMVLKPARSSRSTICGVKSNSRKSAKRFSVRNCVAKNNSGNKNAAQSCAAFVCDPQS